MQHPEDRRKLPSDVTPGARVTVDERLPVLHAREHDLIGAAHNPSEQRTLLRYLAKLHQAAADAQSAPAPDGDIRPRTTRPKADPPDPKGSQP